MVFPIGVEFAVSFFAALRIGAVVSWLDPKGPEFLAMRLAALAPAYIATTPFIAGQLGAFAERVIAPDAPAPVPDTFSYTYDPGAPCLQLWSPLHAAAVSVSADAVSAGALRDATSCLGLRPGDALAAPGFHAMQHQPALLCAAWRVGAAYVHLDEADAVREPALLDQPLRTVGVSVRVRDAYVRARRGQRPPWAHIVRNPEEPCDWEAWRAFFEGCDLGDTLVSNLVIDAASAGALLCSPRRPARQALACLQNVVPAPGRAWQLLDFTRSGQPAVADVGVYAPLDGEDPDEGPIDPQYLVIARRDGEYLYGGTLEPRRSGRLYPVDEVVAIAAPLLDGAAVAVVTSGGAASEARFVLIGFTGGDPPHDPLHDDLRARIVAGLGEDAAPDQIALFPLYARRAPGASDGPIDPAWAQAQYLTGALFRKARSPMFQRLAAMRRSVRAASSPQEDAWR